MSLAEQMPSQDTPQYAGSTATATKIDNILRLALSGGQRAVATTRQGEPDFHAAAELLDRATGALATLTARRDALEDVVATQEEQLRLAQDQAAEWERRAKIMKAQLQDCENRLSEQQIRIETLAYRAENAEARALIAEQTVAEARKQSQMYHDKIVSTFGALA